DIGQKPYNHYRAYLRTKYDGKRVFKIIVDGQFTCPNRDGSKGYGGCTYCNVDSFTPDSARKLPTIREQVEEGIQRAVNGYGAHTIILYSRPKAQPASPVHSLRSTSEQPRIVAAANVVGESVDPETESTAGAKVARQKSPTVSHA